VSAPKLPDDPELLLGRGKRRAFTPEEFGHLLAATSPRFRDHLLCLAGTGLRAGELLGLRASRVDLQARRLEVVSVRYDAGKFGRGYKDRPKTRASIRPVPLAHQVADAIARQLATGRGPHALVFAGPGGGNGVPSGNRTALSRYNLRRAYRAAIARIGDPTADLPTSARRVLKVLRLPGPPQTAAQVADALAAHGRRLRPPTIEAALVRLEAAELTTRISSDGQPRWSPLEPEPRQTPLANLELHGPHDLRHTFSTWLEAAGILSRVIDELMGHAGGRASWGRAGAARQPDWAPLPPHHPGDEGARGGRDRAAADGRPSGRGGVASQSARLTISRVGQVLRTAPVKPATNRAANAPASSCSPQPAAVST
jgi:integrase